MNKIILFLLLVAFGFAGVGCDSNNDDELSIAELLADGWILSGVSDDEGDQLAAFIAGFNSVNMSFTETGNFTINVDAVDPDGDQTISGAFSVDESSNKLTLSTSVPGAGQIQLNFTYVFSGDDQVTLTADSLTSTLLNFLLGTTLQGTVRITISRT